MAALGLAAAGCSSDLHPGSGVVRFTDGEPVRAGSVELRPLDGGDRYASRIAKDGGFTLQDTSGRPGTPPGEYEAVVVLVVQTEDLAKELHTHGRDVPRRYADYYTSGLRVKVESAESPPIELVLEAR